MSFVSQVASVWEFTRGEKRVLVASSKTSIQVTSSLLRHVRAGVHTRTLSQTYTHTAHTHTTHTLTLTGSHTGVSGAFPWGPSAVPLQVADAGHPVGRFFIKSRVCV